MERTRVMTDKKNLKIDEDSNKMSWKEFGQKIMLFTIVGLSFDLMLIFLFQLI